MSRSQYPPKESSQSNQVPSSADELRYWLALLYAPGIGAITFQRILSAGISPQPLFEHPVADVLGDRVTLPSKTLAYIRNPDWSKVEKDLAWAEKPGCHILSLVDSLYPLLLKEIPDPPPLLFVRGNPNVLSL
ncbi:MAG: hypothetical protein V3R49_02470, partial [Gammaproteobacteria bacterium]